MAFVPMSVRDIMLKRLPKGVIQGDNSRGDFSENIKKALKPPFKLLCNPTLLVDPSPSKGYYGHSNTNDTFFRDTLSSFRLSKLYLKPTGIAVDRDARDRWETSVILTVFGVWSDIVGWVIGREILRDSELGRAGSRSRSVAQSNFKCHLQEMSARNFYSPTMCQRAVFTLRQKVFPCH